MTGHMKHNITLEQRAYVLEHANAAEILNRVKPIEFIPGINMITGKRVAEYFGVSLRTMISAAHLSKKALREAGVVSMKPADLKLAVGDLYDVTVSSSFDFLKDEGRIVMPGGGCSFYPPRAVLYLAMVLQKSDVAENIRKEILDTVSFPPARAKPEVKTETKPASPVDEEYRLLSDIHLAYATFMEAARGCSEVLNQSLDVAKARVASLEKMRKEEEERRKAEEEARLEAERQAKAAKVIPLHSDEAVVMEPAQALNSIIRTIAMNLFNGRYFIAWDRFNQELKFQTGITMMKRKAIQQGGSYLDAVSEDEWPKLMKVAASLCYYYGIDVTAATNRATVQAYGLDKFDQPIGVRRSRGGVIPHPTVSVQTSAPETAAM